MRRAFSLGADDNRSGVLVPFPPSISRILRTCVPASCLPEEDFLKLLLLFGVRLGVELLHRDELNFLGIE
jgi:hypothetical protein